MKSWVISASVLFVVTMGATWTAMQQMDRHFAQLDDRSLVQAEDAFEAIVGEQRKHLIASARLLAEDTRIRSTTMTTGFDEGTIRDVLEDLKASTNASTLAVLDATGKVRAVTGAEGLRQVDLSSSPVIEAARTAPASYFWTLPESLLLIGVAAIHSGPRVTAFLLLGSPLGPPQLSPIGRSLDVIGAVFSGDRMIAADTRDAATLDLLRKANTFADGASHIVRGDKGEALTRVTRTSQSATAARVAWLVNGKRWSPSVRPLRVAIVIPALLATLMLGIAVWKLRTPKGGRQ